MIFDLLDFGLRWIIVHLNLFEFFVDNLDFCEAVCWSNGGTYRFHFLHGKESKPLDRNIFWFNGWRYFVSSQISELLSSPIYVDISLEILIDSEILQTTFFFIQIIFLHKHSTTPAPMILTPSFDL